MLCRALPGHHIQYAVFTDVWFKNVSGYFANSSPVSDDPAGFLVTPRSCIQICYR